MELSETHSLKCKGRPNRSKCTSLTIIYLVQVGISRIYFVHPSLALHVKKKCGIVCFSVQMQGGSTVCESTLEGQDKTDEM